ncbi:MAG: PDZ domain-containing protein, partial [Pirellulaceae bacterium]
PELKQDYSHKFVARFDRCRTCHVAIDQTEKGAADKPLFTNPTEFLFELATPAERPVSDDQGNPPTLEQVYGISISPQGLLDFDAVTLSAVYSESLAAKAEASTGVRVQSTEEDGPFGDYYRDQLQQDQQIGTQAGPAGLRVGDVVVEINGGKVRDKDDVRRLLLETATFGQPAQVRVRRGLRHPFSSHPRLDLFVGTSSPHSAETVGCSVCHEGQSGATEFQWTSHTPNNLKDMARWKKEHGWFDNAHWIKPMHASRFIESSCIKCHHEVTDLEPSERFPDPPAPKVVSGFNAVQGYGCFGCHEIRGYDGPDERIGPDLRLEPNYFAVAQQILHADQQNRQAAQEGAETEVALLEEDQRGQLLELVHQPEDEELRHGILGWLAEQQAEEGPQFPVEIQTLAANLRDEETPGKLRKVGPSLRHVASKLESDFLYDWIREPKHFRPSTKMPQFFGLWDHLDGIGLEEAETLEPIEILGMVRYLEEKSQAYEPVEFNTEISESSPGEKAERGRALFETKGCLACHSHSEFPSVDSDHGPDLSFLGNKLASEKGRGWLINWLRDPTRYHPRTKMPDVKLEPITSEDGTVTDPSEDITEFLLSQRNDYQPQDPQLQPDVDALDRLVMMHLQGAFTEAASREYLESGIPTQMASQLTGHEVELLGTASTEAKLQYIGRKSIGKYGCYACHDVPGFEDAKPIGATLNDWGRKETSKLAFEHISEYMHFKHEHHGGHGHGSHGHAEGGQAHTDSEELEPADEPSEADQVRPWWRDIKRESPLPSPYFEHEILAHSRIGFLEQKLREPRSYDFRKTENKGYNDRLRMPKFPFRGDEEREEVMTFILGLVAQPPASQYVFQPDERQNAIIQGRQVINKYNCTACHLVTPERWDLTFHSGDFESQETIPTFPFMTPRFPTSEIQESQQTDAAGQLHGQIVGMPAIGDQDGKPVIYDDFGDPVEDEFNYDPDQLSFRFQLWEPALLDGNTYPVGLLRQDIPSSFIARRHPSEGGFLAKYLLPVVTAAAQTTNPNAKGSEAWAWVPPPLFRQGNKTQSAWLHDFLLDPHPIRPAVVLRMPKFNMSSEEATTLVNYFAAMENSEYPYQFSSRKRSEHLQAEQNLYEQFAREAGEADSANRLGSAMNVILNQDYCIKCHQVGDFRPEGDPLALAPDLSEVHRRLRPDYLRRWLAKPSAILPYTAMPENFKYEPDSQPFYGGIPQDLFHGTSTQQVDGVADLLMNFEDFVKSQISIAERVKQSAPPADSGEAGEAPAAEEPAAETAPAEESAVSAEVESPEPVNE